MFRIEFTPGEHWRSRTPTRQGHIDQPTFGGYFGTAPSTVQGRMREAAHVARQRAHNPQLAPGMLVIHQSAPYRVVEIREFAEDLWPEAFEEQWQQSLEWWLKDPRPNPQPIRATWRQRPVVVVVEPDGGGKQRHLLVAAGDRWDVLPEHYAVCRSCGELPPCSEELRDQRVEQEVQKADHLMQIQPGACMGCGDTIGPRQKSVRFPGPNLWRPDLSDGSAVFHARKECGEFVSRYEAQWVAAGAPAGGMQQVLPSEGA